MQQIAEIPLRLALRLRADQSGAIAVIYALVLPVLLGLAGLAIEGSNWYQSSRSMQNAADEAALAAATNYSSSYDKEAQFVASSYGYTAGVNNIAVSPSSNQLCPDGTSTCYKVVVSRKVPLLFSRVVGFVGNATIGTSLAEQLTSTAVAEHAIFREYCLLTLSTAADSLNANGSPKANLSGCAVKSNGGMTCNGANGLDAAYADTSAASAKGVCSTSPSDQAIGAPLSPDPYSALAPSIIKPVCSSYPGQSWSSNPISRITTVCGDVTLTKDIQLTNKDSVLTISGGSLNLNGHTLSTISGASVTIIFTGPTGSGSYPNAIAPKGTLDIAAPNSGTWSGIAVYQDLSVSSTKTTLKYSGNGSSSLTWNVTGIVYLPDADLDFSGSVSKASSSTNTCFGFIVDKLNLNGGGWTVDHNSCTTAGVTLPTVFRAKLVL